MGWIGELIEVILLIIFILFCIGIILVCFMAEDIKNQDEVDYEVMEEEDEKKD